MKPLNYTERKKQKLAFSVYFITLLSFLFACSYLTLITAEKGIMLLEEKKNRYEEVFKKQAEISFELESIFKNLYSLQNKNRNIGEHKQMQNLITDARKLIEQDIDTIVSQNKYYMIYFEFLNQIEDFQGVMDVYQKEKDKHFHNMEQLEKCKEKYKKISEQKIK